MKKDFVKLTLIKMVSDLKLQNLIVCDGHIESKNENIPTQYPKMLFKSFIDTTHVEVIDFDKYDTYGEEIPPIIVGDVSGIELQFNNKNIGSVISSYDPTNGIIEIDKSPSENCFKYNTTITFADVDRKPNSENKIEIYPISTINRVKNKNITEKIRRYDLILFTFKDDNGDLSDYYSDMIQQVLQRDFILLDENYEKTKSIVYIEDQCRFDLLEYNKNNRVVRGTILLKTII